MLFVVVALRHFAKERGHALGRRQPVENHRTALRGHGALQRHVTAAVKPPYLELASPDMR
jgi:hypothetical protein